MRRPRWRESMACIRFPGACTSTTARPRKRTEKAEAEAGGSSDASAGFVELSGAALVDEQGSGGAVVELSGADGSEMRVRLPVHERVDVAALAQGFWRRGGQ